MCKLGSHNQTFLNCINTTKFLSWCNPILACNVKEEYLLLLLMKLNSNSCCSLLSDSGASNFSVATSISLHSNHWPEDWSLLVKPLDNQLTKWCCFLFNQYGTGQTVNIARCPPIGTSLKKVYFYDFEIFGWVIAPECLASFILGRTREINHIATFLWIWIFCVDVCFVDACILFL